MKDSFTLSQKILAGVVTCTILIAVVAYSSFENNRRYVNSNTLVEHTYRVMEQFRIIEKLTLDAETGMRGFVATSNDVFLESYQNADIEISKHLQQVRELTSDNAMQQKNIDALQKRIAAHFAYLNKCIVLTRENQSLATRMISLGEGKRIEDGIRAEIGNAQGLEISLLNKRKTENEEIAKNSAMVFLILLGIIVIVLAAVYLVITSNFRALRHAESQTAAKNWLLTGSGGLNDAMQGEKNVQQLSLDIINYLCSYLGAQAGALYILENGQLKLAAARAWDNMQISETISLGEGLVGEAARTRQCMHLSDVPKEHYPINSSLGSSSAGSMIIFPFNFSKNLKGVLELAAFNKMPEQSIRLLQHTDENMGVAINSAQTRSQLKELLEKTQLQSETLQSQQEELRQVNEELEEQSQNLRQQQEELKISNEELEEYTKSLESKNKELEQARRDIEQKSRELEVSNRYKSEFLANMSHELRTPLNSLMILAKDLSENNLNNLTKTQVQSASIIYESGHDLLVLINDVLDLAKVEAGKMNVNIERVHIAKFIAAIAADLQPQAKEKKIKLEVNVDQDAPKIIKTDEQRVSQVLKNLLSNAIKFTERGSVSVRVHKLEDRIAFDVKDTGIGISQDMQNIIFEAFHQGDGGTARKYGGTGLGLSISRKLTDLLHGEIKLMSEPGKGSTFTLILPVDLTMSEQTSPEAAKKTPTETTATRNDDAGNISKEDCVILIIEDDETFAEILAKQAQKKGFKVLSTTNGEKGVELASAHQPCAIILDMNLPGMSGEEVLANLKANTSLRHIPVHIISAHDRSLDWIRKGAIEHLVKPINKEELDNAFNRIENFVKRRIRNLLIVEDNEDARKAISSLIGNGDVKCIEASTGKEAMRILEDTKVDCMVLDLSLPDMDGLEFLEKLRQKSRSLPPIVVYTGKELTKEENNALQKFTDSIIIKGEKSEERLLDETALFLHRTVNNLPAAKKNIIQKIYKKDSAFHNKKVLIVDDEARNVFALTKVLADRGMTVLTADNGTAGLQMLRENRDISLVLMDIMMPEMDGYETIRRVRNMPGVNNVCIIAITAKAMKDDRQKCIDAGANDYIAKPVDINQLMELVRIWLEKE